MAFAIIGWCAVAIAQDDPARTLYSDLSLQAFPKKCLQSFFEDLERM
jgi:hypothetical protein